MKINTIIVHSRYDLLLEYMVSPQLKQKTKFGTDYWIETVINNTREEIDWYKERGVTIFYILIERLTHEVMNTGHNSKTLVPLWSYVEKYNQFLRELKSENFYTIDLNNFVCLDEKIPCRSTNVSRKDGVHYDGDGITKIVDFILQ